MEKVNLLVSASQHRATCLDATVNGNSFVLTTFCGGDPSRWIFVAIVACDENLAEIS